MNKKASFDVEAIREDFPILNQTVNEHALVYLDNAATTQKPLAVIDKLTDFYKNDNANVHRSAHALSERATLQFEEARSNIQRFIHAKDYREIVFVRGTTEAINLVANSFVLPRINAGEEILITELEHHSNIVPWQMVCKKTGANLRVAPITNDGEVDLVEFEKLLTPKTKFVAINHISNALGTINPVKKMIEMAHANKALVLVDGAQAGPHAKINVQDLDADFYALSGHKMYGPTGIGALYGKAELLSDMAPYQGGGEMVTHVAFDKTEYQAIPYKFEAGTPNIVGAIALSAAIDYMNSVGIDNIIAHEQSLIDHALKLAKDVPGIGYIGSARERAPIFTFVLNNIHPHDISTVLNSLGVAVRSGHHCAIPAMDRFKVPASTRASFSFYNTHEEVEKLIAAIEEVERVMN